jgi:FkbM family methyltransferase
VNKFYSQYQQDKYLEENYFSKISSGFFIEIGADDGVDKSNTFFFENKGWTGICIEPSPVRFQLLKNNRRCECLNCAISSQKGSVVFLDIIGYGKGLSGIMNHYNPRHLERIHKETENNPQTISKKQIEVQVKRMDDILNERKICKVNYCSIDVEGSEYDILSTINFQEVLFDVFSIEDPYNDTRIGQLMSGNRFEFKAKIGPDLIYVNKNFSSQV